MPATTLPGGAALIGRYVRLHVVFSILIDEWSAVKAALLARLGSSVGP